MGPLKGLRVVEMVGLGPGPFAGMLLADMGADVLRVDRPQPQPFGATGAMIRGKRTIRLDIKRADALDLVLRLADDADAFFEVFRPGVAERLGFGPDVVSARNERLVYGRLTGYGQDGPWANRAGHDIDYLALAGALEPIGPPEKPVAPINVLADFAGGGMLLAWGIACALVERATSGKGQVVDAAMIDGAALFLTPFYAGRTSGNWGPRGTNMLDGGAHFYDTYECADGGWLAVGAIEPQFYAALLKGLGLDDEDPAEQYDAATWPAKRRRLADVIRTRTRDEWCEVFDGLDACVAPALAPDEAPAHPHAVARGAFLPGAQPAPAPRFSRTAPAVAPVDDDTAAAALTAWGLPTDEIDDLIERGVVA